MSDINNNTSNLVESDINEIIAIRLKKLAELKEEGKDPYQITKYDKTHSSLDIIENYASLEGKTVGLAGRIITKRVMGKAAFAHILDEKGQIQIYCRIDVLGEQVYEEFKKNRYRRHYRGGGRGFYHSQRRNKH